VRKASLIHSFEIVVILLLFPVQEVTRVDAREGRFALLDGTERLRLEQNLPAIDDRHPRSRR